MRGTGKTQRMLERAVKEARNGHHVTILCLYHHMPVLRKRLSDLIPNAKLANSDRFVLSDGASITLRSPRHDFDWRRMRFPDTFNALVTADHHAIEATWSHMLTELRRYDD